MEDIEVFVPVGETRVVGRPLAPRLAQLDGARIGWLDNMKANAPELLRNIAAALIKRGANGEMLFTSKNATAAAPESILAHLRNCDAVVLAISD
ncbi:MAG TPA: hypothetical protein DGR97_08545 [Gammaproteobacteria bacterium]|nr:hypothetical protein [Gammaproteobacteria bacterium]|tara:strand:+ start:2970 stop:3251 length:282 start_codon:yes stop_codon:yes gene_type:complete